MDKDRLINTKYFSHNACKNTFEYFKYIFKRLALDYFKDME